MMGRPGGLRSEIGMCVYVCVRVCMCVYVCVCVYEVVPMYICICNEACYTHTHAADSRHAPKLVVNTKSIRMCHVTQ